MKKPSTIIDLQTGPFSKPEEIRKEIKEIEKLPDSDEREDALDELERNLDDSTEIHGNDG